MFVGPDLLFSSCSGTIRDLRDSDKSGSDGGTVERKKAGSWCGPDAAEESWDREPWDGLCNGRALPAEGKQSRGWGEGE